MDSHDLITVLLVIVGAVVLLPVLGMVLWGFGMMGPGMMGPGMMSYGGGAGLLTLVLLIVGIVLIARGLTRKGSTSEEPLEVLKRRLARGEISKEQYEELKHSLQ